MTRWNLLRKCVPDYGRAFSKDSGRQDCRELKARPQAKLKVRGRGGMWPFHRVMLNGAPLPTRFVSKDELEAIISPEAIAKAGTYIVTLKCEGEAYPESHRAHLVVGSKP
jgi:hypothetical protein